MLNAYAVHPVHNGGSNRIHWLYRTLGERVAVDIVTLGGRAAGSDALHVTEGLRELRVARTPAHERADLALQREAHAPVFDIAALANIDLTPEYLTVLENSIASSRLAVLAHPYMAWALRRVGCDLPFIHESQNFELALKRDMLSGVEANTRLLELVEEAERFCCRSARLVYACSDDDAAALLEHYGGPSRDMVVIPNGTDTREIRYADAAERGRLRRRLGQGDRPLAVFVGSGHRPNIEAAQHVLRAAERMPAIDFAFIGNLKEAFAARTLPKNACFTGFVDNEERNVWLHAASVALNPMLYGGGTNLKLLDYFAAGTPVVSSEIGVRGIGAEHGRHVIVTPPERLEEGIEAVLSGGAASEAMTLRARQLVEKEFDWHKLGSRLHGEIVARGLL